MALVKTETLLELSHDPADIERGAKVVVFRHPEERTHTFMMDREVWDDMGSPTEITVTIKPGDHLNPVG